MLEIILFLQELKQGGYFGQDGKVVTFGNYFIEKLVAIQKRIPDAVDGPFGFGGMIAFTPFGGDAQQATRLVRALFDEGVLCLAAGHQTARVRFLLPYGAIDFKDVDAVSEIIERTIGRMASLQGVR